MDGEQKRLLTPSGQEGGSGKAGVKHIMERQTPHTHFFPPPKVPIVPAARDQVFYP